MRGLLAGAGRGRAFALALAVLAVAAGTRDRAEEDPSGAAGAASIEQKVFDAAEGGNVAVLASLLERGPDLSRPVTRENGGAGWSPLMAAAAGGHARIVDQLLAAGAPVDQRNERGRTALFFAAFYGRAAIVDLLLGAGADPHAADASGQTPALVARSSGFDGVAARIERGRDGGVAPASSSGAAP